MPTTREQLAIRIAEAVREFQDATEEVDYAGANLMGVNRTDLRCLGLLGRGGPMTAGQLASEIGLSGGATTTAIDRLVRRGYAERVRDDGDRRRVTIEVTQRASDLMQKVWGPLGAEAQALLLRRDEAELEVILDFLREGTSFQAEQADRIRREDQVGGLESS